MNGNDRSLIIKDNCATECPVNATAPTGPGGESGPPGTCSLTVGGPKNYVPVVCVLYLCTIIFYDLQKVILIHVIYNTLIYF